MTNPENKNVVEMHGCIVCARTIKILAVYALDDRLVDCAVTSFGGHRVPDGQHLLFACDNHTAEDIEAAHQRWHARNGPEVDGEQADEKTAPNGL